MWAYVLALLVGAGGAAWGTWQVQEWRWTANTAAQREAEHQARDSDARQQRRLNDQAAGVHARTVATLNTFQSAPAIAGGRITSHANLCWSTIFSSTSANVPME